MYSRYIWSTKSRMNCSKAYSAHFMYRLYMLHSTIFWNQECASWMNRQTCRKCVLSMFLKTFVFCLFCDFFHFYPNNLMKIKKLQRKSSKVEEKITFHLPFLSLWRRFSMFFVYRLMYILIKIARWDPTNQKFQQWVSTTSRAQLKLKSCIRLFFWISFKSFEY